MDLLNSDLGVMRAILSATLLSAVPLAALLITGLVFGILQAATQIQEATISFVPKLLALMAAFYFAGRWMAGNLCEYLTEILTMLPQLARGSLS